MKFKPYKANDKPGRATGPTLKGYKMKHRIELIQENTECFTVYVKELNMYAQFTSIKAAVEFVKEMAKTLGI